MMKIHIHVSHGGVMRAMLALLMILSAAIQASALDIYNGVYIIRNAQDFLDFGKKVETEPSASARMEADIDLSSVDSWEPIGGRAGDDAASYCGIFDGGGHRIKNLKADNASREWSRQGVFGRVGNCVIANLIVDSSCSISGTHFVGGIVGATRDAEAVNVLIINCVNEGTVEARWIENPTSSGLSESQTGVNAGGIFGCNCGSKATVMILNCYNSGKVIGDRESGSISGWIGTDNCHVDNCYNVGEFSQKWANDTGNGTFCRGGTMSNCYDLVSMSHNNGTKAGVTLVQSTKDISGRLGNSFTGIRLSFPSMESGRWKIKNEDEFSWFIDWVNNASDGVYHQSVDLCAPIDMNKVRGVRPIGTNAHPFRGDFNGHRQAVTNLKYSFFGFINNSNIEGLTIESGHVKPYITNEYSYTPYGTSYNCYYTGTLVGYSYADTRESTNITYCYSRADISDTGAGTNDMGGLVGKFMGTMKYCAYLGTATYSGKTWSAGGFIGSCNIPGDCTSITQCYINGKLDFTSSTSGDQDNLGVFVGSTDTGLYVRYCVYNADGNVHNLNMYGRSTPDSDITTNDNYLQMDGKRYLHNYAPIDDWNFGNGCWCVNGDTDVNPVWYLTHYEPQPHGMPIVWDKCYSTIHKDASGNYYRAPVRNKIPLLHEGCNGMYVRILLPDGTTKYIDSQLRPSDQPSQLYLDMTSLGELKLATQIYRDKSVGTGYLSYHIEGNMVRGQNSEGYIYYYRAPDYSDATGYTSPVLQYHLGKDCEALKDVDGVDMRAEMRSPYIAVGESESDIEWRDGKVTWVEDANLGLQGSSWQDASRIGYIDVDADGRLIFILNDATLQDNARPMNPNNNKASDSSPFAGKGTSWSDPLYVIYDTTKSGTPYLRVGTAAEQDQAVKVVDIKPAEGELEFKPYLGDVYTGKSTWLGSDTPDNLRNDSRGLSNWKTEADDSRLASDVRMQRAHELERDVWVFPGEPAALKPFSDFEAKIVGNYYVRYLRWYDYQTGKRSDGLTFNGTQQPLQGADGHFAGSFLTGDDNAGATAYGTFDGSDNVLAVIGMDAAANINSELLTLNSTTGKYVVNEPTLAFRSIFNVRNAKLRADQMTASVAANEQYIEQHRISLITRETVPFQYRLDCSEDVRWGEESEPTDYWVMNADGTYDPVYHYIVGTKYEDEAEQYTINTRDETKDMKPGLAYTYKKSVENRNVSLYMLQPKQGTYTITLYAASKYRNGDQGTFVNIQGTDTPVKLMQYTLRVLSPKDASMINEYDFYREENKGTYQHQWPEEMRKYYGTPKVTINFDDVLPEQCGPGDKAGLVYRWPRPWAQSSYGFGYNYRYDYNMYVVANHAQATPYREAAERLTKVTAYPYHQYALYDRLYAETKGARQGFFYYTNAAGDPGRMAVLNIGSNFCDNTEVFVSAWVKEFSATQETANVVFTFKGVTEDGTEITLSSFVTGYVAGGSNTLYDTQSNYSNFVPENVMATGTKNPEDRGKWMHVYYHFTPEARNLGYDHYIISVENNCVSSSGADYAIDDIEAFVCTPAVQARQLKPVCNNDHSTNLFLTVDFDRLMPGFGFSEATTAGDGKTQKIAYCFLDRKTYQSTFESELKNQTYNPDEASEVLNAKKNADKVAFEAALIKGTYGSTDASDAHYRYGVLSLNTYYDSNPRYQEGSAQAYTERVAMSMDPLNNIRTLVFPSDIRDVNMKVGNEYLIALIVDNGKDPGAEGFRIYDECSKVSEFTLAVATEVKVDGKLQSCESDISLCANERPIINVDLNYISKNGDVVRVQNATLDWYLGPVAPDENYADCFQNATHSGVLLQDALGYFREYYPAATESDFRDATKCTPKGSYTQNHRDCILKYLNDGAIRLAQDSVAVSTVEQYNETFATGRKFYLVAVPFDPDPSQGNVFCLDPTQVSLGLNDRQPSMMDGDGQGTIEYPNSLTDVPLRIGLRQLQQARMQDAGTPESVAQTTVSKYVIVPLRDVTPVTPGVTSFASKANDDFIYLTASDDPNVLAGRSGALKASADAAEGDVRIVGRVVDIQADKNQPTSNKCSLGFIRGFQFREGYSYTIKFHYVENYDATTGEHLDVCPGDVAITIKVVPEYVKWTGAVNSDWNNDGNWSRVSQADLNVRGESWNDFTTDGGVNDRTEAFVPADFTRVIIPADTEHLPQLYDLHQKPNVRSVKFVGSSGSYDFIRSLNRAGGSAPTATQNINYDMAAESLDDGNVACRVWYDHTAQQIHFRPNAEMLAQEYLTYQQAWVDVQISTDKWYTLVSPLTGVVAGDMYLPRATGKQETPLFQPITFDTQLYDRFSPAVYQRAWDKAQALVYEQEGKSRDVVVKSSWSHVYNDVSEQYPAGTGFSIKVHADQDQVLFRLPKDDKQYTYYAQGSTTGGNTTTIVGASEERSHRLYTPGETVDAVKTGTDGQYFLVGNPFMAHLDMAKFFAANTQYEAKYWVMTAGGQASAIMNPNTGGFVGSASGTVAPLQGFFVQLKNLVAKSTTPVFTADMQTLEGRHTIDDETGLLDRTFWSDAPVQGTRSVADDMLTITAQDGTGNITGQAHVLLSPLSQEQYDDAEDVALLQDDEIFTTTNVYTVAGDTRSLINTLPAITRLPLGVTARRNQVTTLTFTGVQGLGNLTLVDEQTGETQPVSEGMQYRVQGSSAGRLFLVGDAQAQDKASSDIAVHIDGRTITIQSATGALQATLYSTDGQLIETAHDSSGTVVLQPTQSGIYMLKVVGEGTSLSQKVMIK